MGLLLPDTAKSVFQAAGAGKRAHDGGGHMTEL